MCRAGGQPPSKVVVQHSTRAKTTGCGAYLKGPKTEGAARVSKYQQGAELLSGWLRSKSEH